MKRWNGNAGQAATESMLVISVVTIAIVAAGYSFVPLFQSGVGGLATDVAEILETGDIGGSGNGNGNGNGNDSDSGSGSRGGGGFANSTSRSVPETGSANGRRSNGRRYVPGDNGNDSGNRGNWPPSRAGLGPA